MGHRRRPAVIALLFWLIFTLTFLHGQVVGVLVGPHLLSISITSLPGTCTNGNEYGPNATGNYSQSYSKNITSVATWSCVSNCRVNFPGDITITGSAGAHAVVLASYQGKTGNAQCTISGL